MVELCASVFIFFGTVTVKFSVKLKCELKREEKEKKIDKIPCKFSDYICFNTVAKLAQNVRHVSSMFIITVPELSLEGVLGVL